MALRVIGYVRVSTDEQDLTRQAAIVESTRAAGYGWIKDYLNRANAEICVLVQTETRVALDNLDEICKVDGIDGDRLLACRQRPSLLPDIYQLLSLLNNRI